MTPVLALWISIALGGAAQIALKLSVSGRNRPANVHGLGWWTGLLASGWFWLYVACFGIATALWLLALSDLNISYAFPLLSLNYPIVAFLARFCLKERVPASRWAAIAVICCGVILIAQS
jgi:drug/metabolite transporter (DMT)-like permease